MNVTQELIGTQLFAAFVAEYGGPSPAAKKLGRSYSLVCNILNDNAPHAISTDMARRVVAVDGRYSFDLLLRKNN